MQDNKIQLTFNLNFHSISTKTLSDKVKETNLDNDKAKAVDKTDRKQGSSSNSHPFITPSYNPFAPTSSSATRQPHNTKVDATDRRQIEAINEDKSHSTKETLHDIKLVHQIEKKKKEQDDIQIIDPVQNIDLTIITPLSI